MDERIAARAIRPAFSMHPAWLTGALACVALALFAHRIDMQLPMRLWGQAIRSPDLDDIRQLVIYGSDLPRLVVCVLAGALLSLAGTIFQQVLRNPLAEPTTLGVSAGASLALSIALLFAPQWLFAGQSWIAFAGAALGMLCVVALAWRRRLAPVSLILAGLLLNFYCGSINAVLIVLHHDALQSLFIWDAGALNQNNWDAPTTLFPCLVIGAVLAAILARPLTTLSLSDERARGLGVPLRFVKLGALALAVYLAASVVASVGVIGFLGMLAPTIVRLTGARRFKDRLIWAPLFGAALLWSADEIMQSLTGAWAGIPTGAALSLLGAPFLFWLLPRLPARPVVPDTPSSMTPGKSPKMSFSIACGALVLATAVVMALALGASAHGWHASLGHDAAMLHWRGPRVAAALVAGLMLAIAGAILQRVTRNAMASPEVLGISTGASLGLIGLLFMTREAGDLLQIGAAGAGAFATLLVLLALGRRHDFAPERVLLVGVTLGTALSALVTVLLASDDPRMSGLLAWMAGSTYDVSARDAAVFSIAAIGLIGATALCVRWLDILPLGERAAASLGVGTQSSQLALLLLAALMTGVATILMGPFSFIGLMAPHLARMLGFRRAGAHLAAAAMLGASIMVLADWLGRNALFPLQIPVGLVATLLGGLYFMGLMIRGKAAI
ncbi:Fe(3+)-hydroxamate ABC transporter permease FhuB [Pararobbsia silviterrae]|uniref:Fe(3+)-hydroxamate ABC transporter permease FhuB n=1 Tax=Pararobbsia silviterrae TaxID=1792498 RepID=A0A494XSM0_9BURK|nr:Fe(3+)-hydroxamate ABC transporter permease FhuB [Pararobbsia silviterrae]RKP53642.1 Fe(3+)-hydroxamate ABC transporter permease FhuB [Pararobbsia silviterrae]